MTATGLAIMEVDSGLTKCIFRGRLWDLNAIDPEGRRNAEHIAIIVVVDLVPIQSHLDSSNFSATNIADDGHRPIQLAWHGKLLVQGEDVSTSTAKKRVVTPTLGAAIVLEKVLRTACARRVGRRRGPTATVIVRGMDGIGILRMWIIYGVSIAIRIQNGCGV